MNMNVLSLILLKGRNEEKRHHDQIYEASAAALMIQIQNFQAWNFQALLGDASRTSGSSVSGPVSGLGRPDGPTGMTDAVFEAGHFLGDR